MKLLRWLFALEPASGADERAGAVRGVLVLLCGGVPIGSRAQHGCTQCADYLAFVESEERGIFGRLRRGTRKRKR